LIAPASAPERACARIDVALHGQALDRVSLTPTTLGGCGNSLTLALGGTPEFDRARHVVRLPLLLQNTGTRPLGSPARLYGWEDSLAVVSPPGLATNKHRKTYLGFSMPTR